MAKFTDEEFEAALERAVQERGEDYVYPQRNKDKWVDEYHNQAGGCVYSTPDGTPACIIGLALSYLDPSLVPDYNDTNAARDVLPGIVSSVAATAAQYAQDVQDGGDTWGVALETYHSMYAGLTEDF